MIGRLSGTLVEKNPPQILLDVKGVAYEIDVPMSTFYNLPNVGDNVILFTHLVVREDALAVDAADMMEQFRITSVLVLDADGLLTGALNSNDLMRAKVI